MGTIQDMLRKVKNFQSDIQDLGMKTIPIIPDAKGMLDRECPKNECKCCFKVNAEDWRNITKAEGAFCPICRNNSPAIEYMPKSQRKEIISSVRSLIMDNWHHGTPMSQNISPIQSVEEFELDITCESCKTRFSVIGAAFFCPSCGYNSIERTAKEAIEKLILKAEKIFEIQKALEQTLTKDEVAIIIRSIIENSLSDCIGVLQTFNEVKYNSLSATNAPFNAFQNVEKSNKLWIDLKGEGYETWLTKEELNSLLLFTQRRHLLEHKGGLVDLKYLQVTNDKSYSEGERIIVTPAAISTLGKIILKTIESINKL
ncbi:MAG: hypothetical protein MH132_00070 [Hydrotalea sp.]|nr:hypothetical protein [Hydrotalea sp.]